MHLRPINSDEAKEISYLYVGNCHLIRCRRLVMTEVSIRILFVAFLGHGLQAIMRNLKGKYKISVFPCSRILSDGYD